MVEEQEAFSNVLSMIGVQDRLQSFMDKLSAQPNQDDPLSPEDQKEATEILEQLENLLKQ